MKTFDRFRFCLSRQIKFLANFSSQRTTDRRLKILTEAKYIQRRKVLYGIPYLYSLTYQGKTMIHTSTKIEKIRIEQIMHNIAVIDTVIYFMLKHKIELKDIVTEKELHRADGYGQRKHHPDFVIKNQNSTICVEVELTLKAKDRLEKNIQDNFLSYDYQKWIVPEGQVKIHRILKQSSSIYPLDILELEEVQRYVKNYSDTE